MISEAYSGSEGKESACQSVQGTQEIQVRPLGGEDPLEEEMATPSSVLAWRIPWKEEFDGPWSMGLQSGTRLSTWHILTYSLR